MPLKMEGFLVF